MLPILQLRKLSLKRNKSTGQIREVLEPGMEFEAKMDLTCQEKGLLARSEWSLWFGNLRILGLWDAQPILRLHYWTPGELCACMGKGVHCVQKALKKRGS